MATLKVGQRVRIVGVEKPWYQTAVTVGHEGVIVRRLATHWEPSYIWVVDVPSCPFRTVRDPNASKPSEFFYRSCDLAPLVGPEETEWAQGKVKQLLKDVKNPIPLEL